MIPGHHMSTRCAVLLQFRSWRSVAAHIPHTSRLSLFLPHSIKNYRWHLHFEEKIYGMFRMVCCALWSRNMEWGEKEGMIPEEFWDVAYLTLPQPSDATSHVRHSFPKSLVYTSSYPILSLHISLQMPIHILLDSLPHSEAAFFLGSLSFRAYVLYDQTPVSVLNWPSSHKHALNNLF